MFERNIVKECKKCGELKPLTEFRKQSAAKDKKHPFCRVCHSKSVKGRYLDNKQYVTSKITSWQKQNPDKVKQYSLTWRAKQKEIRRLAKIERNKLKEQNKNNENIATN